MYVHKKIYENVDVTLCYVKIKEFWKLYNFVAFKQIRDNFITST